MTVWRYFDHAATSAPKPPVVIDAMTSYLRENGAPAGRGSYRRAMEVERLLTQARQYAARLLGATDARQIVWTNSGTDGLNTALWGLCRPGDHVVASTWEHNSVLRPLRALVEQRGVSVSYVEPGPAGQIDPQALASCLQATTRLVVLQHANNVVGTIQPLADIGRVVRDHGAIFVVDAAQSAGHFAIDVHALSIDVLVTSGHKGLLGPLGTGLMWLAPRVSDEMRPLRYGGTGTSSEDDHQPATLPEKFEAGNLNVPGLVGLGAALQLLSEADFTARRAHEVALTGQLWEGLSRLSGVTLHGAPPSVVPRTGVISLELDSLSAQEAALILDEAFGIACRAGLHCAPGVHRHLGTIERGGSLRLSIGETTTSEDVEAVIEAIASLALGS